MRVSVLSTFVALSVCGCFGIDSRASEVKNLQINSTLTSPSFSVDEASAVSEAAMQNHNETKIEKLTINNSDEEARATTIEDLLEKMAHFIKGHVGYQMKNLLEVHYTSEKRPDSHLVTEINSLQMKKQRTKNDDKHLLSLIQQLQDHDDPYLQQTGAKGLVDMLRSGMYKSVHNARYDIHEDHAEGSENNRVNQQLVEAWITYVVKWLRTKELTAKQAQLYESLLTNFSENEITKLAIAIQDSYDGRDAVERFVLLLVADSLTREHGFRLQVLRGESGSDFLISLLFYQRQDPASLPLNIWLEFVAFTRFITTFSDRTQLRGFAESIFSDLEVIAEISRPKQKKMFTAIARKKFYKLDTETEGNHLIRVFEWSPEDRDESKRFEDNLIDLDEKTALTDALENEAVVKLLGAAEVLNKEQVLTEVQKDPKVVNHLEVVLNDYHNFKVFKEALRDRQVKMLAKELL